MSQSPFQKSQNIQEDFVNGLAETMAALAQKDSQSNIRSMGLPFSAATGREFSGANMVRLMLTSMDKGYSDNRWITFKQLEQFQSEHPALDIQVRKGEKGTKVLWPQEVSFVLTSEGEKEILTKERQAEMEEMQQAGIDTPKVQKGILFYSYTLFNAEQIEGFPPREKPAPELSVEEKQELVDRFIASSGVKIAYTEDKTSFYAAKDDKIIIPDSEKGKGLALSAMKLREFFHATGYHGREFRSMPPKKSSLRPYALEEMRGEFFSTAVSQYLGLPAHTKNAATSIQKWNQIFTGGDARALLQTAMQAGNVLTLLHQYKEGETPKAEWFPPAEQWEKLFQQNQESEKPIAQLDSAKPVIPTIQPALAQKLQEFESVDDPVLQVRMILRNPEFLEMALKKDPECARDLASLCDSMAMALHMELDQRSQQQEPAQPATVAPTSAPRMRM